MARFTKSTAFGYKDVPGGQSDPEFEYAILSKEEYDALYTDVDYQKYIANKKIEAANREMSKKIAETNTKIKVSQEIAEKKVEEFAQKLAEAQKEVEYYKKLNQNLLRITKERANSNRNLKPKKEHTGYVVLSSRESDYKYKESRHKWETVILWETTLQSPYSVEFTEDQARKLIEELFNPENWIIGKIGIAAQWIEKYEDIIEDKDYKDDYQYKNFVMKKQLRANYVTGYWEVILKHTKPLENVPKDMMRCSYR